MTKPDELKHELAYFTGTENYYRHGLNRNVVYTDGVRHFAERAGAHWLLDILATEPEVLEQAKDFAAITMTVQDSKAGIVVTDGNDRKVFVRQMEFTDCPPGVWQFYFYDNTILLPSEY